MTLLGRYARSLAKSRGLEHVMTVSVLRAYIKNTPAEILCSEVESLCTLEEMRAIAEAGISKKIWDCYTYKLRTML